MRRMLMHVALGAVASLAGSEARADVLYITGGESGANASYAFLGAIVPLPGNSLGSGFAVRVWADHLAYKYDSGPNTVKATGWGGETAGVYQFSSAWGWTNLSLGLRYRDTKLSPLDLSNRSRGAHIRAGAQIDGGINLDDAWRFRWIGSVTSTVNGYYLQPAIDRSVFANVRLGVDGTLQGDETYQQSSVGANASITIRDRYILGLRVGSTVSGAKTGLYGGASLVFTAS